MKSVRFLFYMCAHARACVCVYITDNTKALILIEGIHTQAVKATLSAEIEAKLTRIPNSAPWLIDGLSSPTLILTLQNSTYTHADWALKQPNQGLLDPFTSYDLVLQATSTSTKTTIALSTHKHTTPVFRDPKMPFLQPSPAGFPPLSLPSLTQTLGFAHTMTTNLPTSQLVPNPPPLHQPLSPLFPTLTPCEPN